MSALAGYSIHLAAQNHNRRREAERTSRLLAAEMAERRVAENTLRELHEVMESAVEGIAFLATSGTIRAANPAFADLVGIPHGSIAGQSISAFLQGPDFERATAGCVGNMRTAREVTDFAITSATIPEPRYVQVTSVPHVDKRTGEAGVYWFMRNVTETRRALDALESQKAQTIHAARLNSLGEMASGIAHEINNPLMIIIGRVAQLKMQVVSHAPSLAEIARIGESIEKTTTRIAAIIRNLKTFARADQVDALLENVTIDSIVQDALALCKEKIRLASIELKVNVDSVRRPVRCRPIQVGQVILNLLSNAIYAVNCLDEKWIAIEAMEQDDALTLTVTDSGRGIPPDVHAKLFQPFFTTRDVGEGTGLGLSVSRGIIDSHGGTIRVDTEKRHTTFVVTLPFEPPGQGGSTGLRPKHSLFDNVTQPGLLGRNVNLTAPK